MQLEWLERMDVTSQDQSEKVEEPNTDSKAVHDDFKREMKL